MGADSEEFLFFTKKERQICLSFSLSYQMEMLQRLFDTILIDVCRNIIRNLFYLVFCVAHCHADTGKLQHTHVILTIAKGHDFLRQNSHFVQQTQNGSSLSAPFGNQIHTAGMPAGDFSGFSERFQHGFLFPGNIYTRLIQCGSFISANWGYLGGN